MVGWVHGITRAWGLSPVGVTTGPDWCTKIDRGRSTVTERKKHASFLRQWTTQSGVGSFFDRWDSQKGSFMMAINTVNASLSSDLTNQTEFPGRIVKSHNLGLVQSDRVDPDQ